MNRDQHVREIAYLLWEQAGRPQGHELDFWLEAEATYEAGGRSAIVSPHTQASAGEVRRPGAPRAAARPRTRAAARGTGTKRTG